VAAMGVVAACRDQPVTHDGEPVAGADVRYRTDDGRTDVVKDSAVLTDLEQKLARQGLYRGPVDGDAHPQLAAAVQKYKAQNWLGQDNVIDRATANRLGIDWSRLASPPSVGDSVKGAVERAGDKLENGTKEAAKRLDHAAQDVKKDLKDN